MRKTLLLLLAIFVSVSMARADEEFDYEIDLGNFSKLKVYNNVNVVYTASADSAGRARFRAPKALSDLFIVSNHDGTLKVETRPLEPGEKNLPTLYVYSEFLSEANNDSDSTLFIRKVAPCPTFKAIQVGNGRLVVDDVRSTEVMAKLNTGNGTIIVNGQCSDAKLKMIGTGLIQSDNLRSDNVECSILGSGTIGCWPRFELKVKGIGSTKIYYKGKPDIKKKGGGKPFRIDSTDDEPEYVSRDE